MNGYAVILFSSAILAVLCIILSIPLILRKVPPNLVYGLRIKKTLADPTLWYSANRITGWFFFCAGVLSLLGVGFLLWWRPTIHSLSGFVLMTQVMLLPILGAAMASFFYVRHLSGK